MSHSVALATRSGDLSGLTQLLASDVRVETDGGGKAAAALNVIEGADRAARFLVGATRKGWREDFTVRFYVVRNPDKLRRLPTSS
jgi:RNA polymerase sigma-70 factor (ECF subfamily)